MASRRSFLKVAGMAAMAAGAGYTFGKFIGSPGSSRFTVHGFIPEDEEIIRMIVGAFRQKAGSHSRPAVFAEGRVKEILMRAVEKAGPDGFSKRGAVTYRARSLPGPVDADIVVGDDKVSLYSPENAFPISFAEIRNSLKGRKADCLFTARCSEHDFLSSIFKSGKKEVVVENEKGVAERIPLDKNYSAVRIDGPLGKTLLKISNGTAFVHASACRHGLCRQARAFDAGDIIACAPNKVLIRIERA
jgi:hypothetical protein